MGFLWVNFREIDHVTYCISLDWITQEASEGWKDKTGRKLDRLLRFRLNSMSLFNQANGVICYHIRWVCAL